MPQQGVFRRRNLPHIDVDGKPYFVTACLEGSLSAIGLSRIKKYRDELEQRPKPEGLSQQEWQLRIQNLVATVARTALNAVRRERLGIPKGEPIVV